MQNLKNPCSHKSFFQGTLAAACSPVLSSSVLRDTGNTLKNALLPEPAINYILAYSAFLSQKEIIFKKWPIIFVFVRQFCFKGKTQLLEGRSLTPKNGLKSRFSGFDREKAFCQICLDITITCKRTDKNEKNRTFLKTFFSNL